MAAPLGFKTFNTGDVLTAADTNGYLMQGVWVFANAAARTAAVTSPQEGNVSFLKDTNSLEIYDGAAWVAYGAGDITGVTAGTGITGGGTSGTVTITNDMATKIDAKGDLVIGTGADTYDRLAVGTNNFVLTADSAESTGVKWAAVSAPTFSGCSVKSSTDQTISTATDTVVNWDQEDFDTDSYHSNVTNNGRITIPSGKAGKYQLNGIMRYDANTSGLRSMRFRKNGTIVKQTVTVPNASNPSFGMSMIIDLAVGDYVEMSVFQNSGSNQTFLSSDTQAHFSAGLLGA